MGKSSSSSQANQQSHTTQTDRRIVNDAGLTATDGASISFSSNVHTLDAGIVSAALETVQMSDATNSEGFGKLLSLADKIITGGGDLVKGAQQNVYQAYQSAAAEKAGTIDNKTIMILGVAAAGAVAVAAMSRKG